MARVDDWQVYLNDPDKFDEDHFAYCLVDDDPEFYIPPEVMFSFTQSGAVIVDRITALKKNTVFNGMYYMPRNDYSQAEGELLKKCKECIGVLAEYAKSKGDLREYDILRTVRYKVVKDIDLFHEYNTDTEKERSDTFMNLERDFSDALVHVNECYHGASEAVLSMTNMPMIKNFILSPDVAIDINLSAFFELYVGGGQFADFSEEVVLFVPEKI